MADQSKKGSMKGIRPKHVILDEVSEYFSKDIEFDWPESYEPAFPLTEAERRLQALNGIPANFIDYTHGRITLVPLVPDEDSENK